MRLARLHTGLLVGVLALTSCTGTPGDPTPSPTHPSFEITGGAQTIAPEDLKEAVRALRRLDTGTFVVSVLRPADADIVAMLPRVTGSWSFRQQAGSSTEVVQDATAGTITINQILLPGVGYLQSLYEGSDLAPSCWLRVRTGDTFLRLPPSVAAVLDAQALDTATDTTNGTLLLTDVLGAIGFQKMATRHADDLFGARVEVWLRITNGVVTGWAVTSEALSSALDAAGISSEWGQDLIDFIQQFDDAQWGVDFGGLGVPVSIEAPPKESIIKPGQETCPG